MNTNVLSIQGEFGGYILLHTENIDLAGNQVALIELTEVVYDSEVADGTLIQKKYVHIDVSEDQIKVVLESHSTTTEKDTEAIKEKTIIVEIEQDQRNIKKHEIAGDSGKNENKAST
ncbi:hypothetical protein JTB14_003866 [Gonioctena quinquepunctata]|nr:hypothetical protein JTB14_003866 [Gonioctena quinquepunctata]